MSSWNPDERVIQRVAAAFEQALASLTGGEFTVAALADEEAKSLTEPIIWQQSFSLIDGPALWIAAGRDLWEPVARLTLTSAGVESIGEEDCRSTWQELLSQAAAGVAIGITGEILRELTPGKGEVIDWDLPRVEWYVFSVTGNGATALFHAGWLKVLADLYDRRAPQELGEAVRGANVSRTFDLLLDVALPVSVSFGKASLPIGEVLKLSTGSIVELNRFASDPVDVMVNGCVIARGEVVVVDGNYGVRIGQLASREDRLRTGMNESARMGAEEES